MSRDWKLYLADIRRCCERVHRYTSGMTQQQFLADDRTYDAVVRNLEIIGEAVKGLPPDVRQQMPNIEWQKIAGMRDWLAHAYLGSMPTFFGTSSRIMLRRCRKPCRRFATRTLINREFQATTLRQRSINRGSTGSLLVRAIGGLRLARRSRAHRASRFELPTTLVPPRTVAL